MKLTEDVINKNYNLFINALTKIGGESAVEKLIDSLGGEEAVKNAPYFGTKESGTAYDGSLVRVSLKIAKVANEINKLFPEEMQTDSATIYKIALLNGISKVLMFEKNNNAWEVENRGIIYKYANIEGALRTGERSCLLVLQAGFKLTPTEFEALRIIDKNDDDNYSKFFSSQLSLIIKQAIDIVMQIERTNV